MLATRIIPVLDPATQCRNKVKYQSFTVAHEEAVRLAKKEGVAFTVYPCPHCETLHVGRVK